MLNAIDNNQNSMNNKPLCVELDIKYGKSKNQIWNNHHSQFISQGLLALNQFNIWKNPISMGISR